MAGYSNEELFNLFCIHGECNKIVSRTCRKFNGMYPHLPPMTEKKFRRYQNNFLRTGSVCAKKTKFAAVTANEDNEVSVLAYFEAYPRVSIATAEHDLGIPHSSIHRILRKHKMHSYKFVTVCALQEQDHQLRVEFCEMLLVRYQEDPNFLQNIIWTDESKFSHEGIFNRHNSHFWAQQNPHLVRERGFQNKFSFNVFAMLMNNKCCYFIYNETLKSRLYLQILRTVVAEFLEDLPLQVYMNCWYQLDGAPAHSSGEVRELLDELFEDRYMGRGGPWSWPPRSPDLTPLDFYLWGKIKSSVYFDPVDSKEDLENRVRNCFNTLDPNEIQRATTSGVMLRVIKCLDCNGGHFEQFL